ncbi:MAG: GNAT family N-acetyltransferase [Mesorhizobium sp.]
MNGHSITRLDVGSAAQWRGDLIDILIDAVESGAGVSFVLPMTRAKAEHWWDDALASMARGERMIFVAELNGRADGTVQLVPAPQENQTFRADIAKMLVHRRARRMGLGRALLEAAEQEASQLGRDLLTLDTVTDSAGERLYAGCGWTKFGVVPGYALTASGDAREDATFFYKKL